jgi:flagellar hook-length control protein FliK
LGSAAVANAAGLTAAAVQQALHAPVDASTQPAGAPAAAGTSNSNNATSTPNEQHQPNLQPLPASLGDVSRASEFYQRMGNSEMRIAVETDLLGTIDLHATMHQSTLTATIGVQRSDVQTLLANDLPALQHTLADQHFHIENISVHDNSAGQRMGSSGQQENYRQNSPPHTAPAARGIPGVDFSPARELDPAMTPASRLDRYATGLSIHV